MRHLKVHVLTEQQQTATTDCFLRLADQLAVEPAAAVKLIHRVTLLNNRLPPPTAAPPHSPSSSPWWEELAGAPRGRPSHPSPPPDARPSCFFRGAGGKSHRPGTGLSRRDPGGASRAAAKRFCSLLVCDHVRQSRVKSRLQRARRRPEETEARAAVHRVNHRDWLTDWLLATGLEHRAPHNC